jgi:hypothetical protein
LKQIIGSSKIIDLFISQPTNLEILNDNFLVFFMMTVDVFALFVVAKFGLTLLGNARSLRCVHCRQSLDKKKKNNN